MGRASNDFQTALLRTGPTSGRGGLCSVDGHKGHQSGIEADNQDVARSFSHDFYCSPAEAAQLLSVSPRTLANWRSLREGPPYKKVGGKIVYIRQNVLDFKTESEPSRGSKPHVTLSLGPYPRDRTRIRVDIRIALFAHGATIRSRPVAPRGMEEVAARAWGEKQAKSILRKRFKGSAAKNAEDGEVQPKKNSTMDPEKSKAPTMAELWVKYETEILSDKEKSRPKTYKTYDKLWRRMRDIIGKIPCDCWTKDDSKKVAAKFKHLSGIYANTAMTLVANIFALAVEDEWIEEVPKLLRRKSKSRPKEPAHNAEDIKCLLVAAREMEAMNGEALELMVLMGIDAGLRPGEVAGLRWKDVDWHANQLIIVNQRPFQMPEDQDYPVKYDLTGRINMTARLRVALEAHRDRVGTHRKFIHISGKTGRAIHTDIVSDRIFRIHVRAGLRPKSGHWLRHCAASRVAHHPKASLSDAQDLLRHKHMSTTDVYISQIRGKTGSRRAAAILDLLIEEETGTGLAPGGVGQQNTREELN